MRQPGVYDWWIESQPFSMAAFSSKGLGRDRREASFPFCAQGSRSETWLMSPIGTLRHSARRIILSPVECTADKHGRRPWPRADIDGVVVIPAAHAAQVAHDAEFAISP
jgi:hypothetical protein